MSSREAGGNAATTVLVVDDHQMMATALGNLLAAEPDLHVAATVGTVDAALAACRAGQPDVVLMDYQLPDGSGADAARRILAHLPATRVIMLTAHGGREFLVDALDAGCVGFVHKVSAFTDLVTAIRAVVAGEMVVPQDVLWDLVTRLRSVAPAPAPCGSDLSLRECEVLRQMATGARTQDIADCLFISVVTVRNHIQRILSKLDAHSRLEAVTTAVRRGLVDMPRPGPPGA